jgi:hypothetical protein
MRILESSPPPTLNPRTPQQTTNLNLSLLQSSPLEAIELSRPNKRLTEAL